MSTNRQRGKACERSVAKTLGGKRVGTLSGEDIHFDGPWSVECKSRKAFVANSWMAQAIRNAHGKTPMVVVHTHGKQHAEDLVMMRMEDFIDWFGPLGEARNDLPESGTES